MNNRTERNEHFVKALKAFGWECGPEFEKRYITDAWVFNLANAVDRLTYRVEELEERLDESASLIMAVDTVGPDRHVVIPEGWFYRTNDLLARIRKLRGDAT